MKDSSFEPMTMQQIEALAAKHGCSVVIAAENELQYDLDTPQAVEQFYYFYNLKLCAESILYPRTEWKSRGGNTHIVVTLPEPRDIVQRIALQAMGGSDAGREFAALKCHNAGSPHPVLLFKPLLEVR